jgi:hypothetical protein
VSRIIRFVLFLVFFAGFGVQSGSPAQALVSGSTTCNIVFVSLPAKGPRLLVKCDALSPGANGAKIEYFAHHLGQDAERGRLVLSLLMTAKASGRPVRITYFTDDASSNAWDMGCNPVDCRPIVTVELL